jgi:hypothetical protein
VWGALSEVARQLPILFPVHPRTRARIESFGLPGNGIGMIDPVGYLDVLYAVKGAVEEPIRTFSPKRLSLFDK